MKKVFNLFLMAGAVVALASCNPGNNNPDNGKGEVTFEVTVSNVKATTAQIDIKPSADTVAYCFNIVEAEDLKEFESKEAYADTLITYMKAYVDYIIEAGLGEYMGVSSANDILSIGADGYEFSDLDPETGYVALAFCVDTVNFKPVGKVAFKEFTTTAIKKSENVISFVQDADNKALIHINATNNDPYLWMLIEKDTLAYYYGGDAAECISDYVSYLDELGYLDYFISEGSEEYLTSDEITEPAMYTFIAVGLEGTVINTDAFTADIDVTADMCGTEEEIADEAPRKAAALRPAKSISKRFALK